MNRNRFEVNLERQAHKLIGRIGLHLLDFLQNPLHRRILPIVLIFRHLYPPRLNKNYRRRRSKIQPLRFNFGL